MSTIRTPLHVKLFVGMLAADPSLFTACTEILAREFGPPDLESGAAPWTCTDYYRAEMGERLLRSFVFFGRLIDPGRLPGIKVFTNRLEERFGTRGPDGTLIRRINLDPGYLTEAKVVLASTKDFAHRLYIGDGIYAEVTLQYHSHDHGFAALATTYPDYGSDSCRSLFEHARRGLRKQLHGDTLRGGDAE